MLQAYRMVSLRIGKRVLLKQAANRFAILKLTSEKKTENFVISLFQNVSI